jgi:type I restriction-modification system DNA methylase subunit
MLFLRRSMKKEKETFASLMQQIGYEYDLRIVFDDFLTMTLAAFSQNPITGKSYDEDIYMQTVGKYKKKDMQALLPKLLGALVLEMDESIGGSMGHDILGSFYELHLSRKGAQQFFTPWTVCEFMARIQYGEDAGNAEHPLRVIDPCCGSGRMLLAGAKVLGPRHHYYAIDIDHTCVKMAAINLFLSGVFHGEVMWANALVPDDFRMSYKISFLPFGIFRVEEKEKSELWYSYQQSFADVKSKMRADDLVLPSESKDNGFDPTASQLKLF